MPKRRELPRDFIYSDAPGEEHVDSEGYMLLGHSSTTPENPFEALMSCAPNEEPGRDIESMLPLRDVLNDALTQLDEQEQWIFDALIVRRLSVRQLAEEINMPKSTVHRWKERACRRVMEILEENPIVKEHLR